jgi:hypothetical protein
MEQQITIIETGRTVVKVTAEDTIETVKFPSEERIKIIIGDTPWKNILSASFGSVVPVAALTTTFAQITGRAATFSSEINTQYVIPENCKLQRLFIVTSNTQPASGSLVLTLRVNGASTVLTVTIPANSAAGVFSDIADSVSLTAGDLICYQLVNNSSSSSATIISIGSTLTK